TVRERFPDLWQNALKFTVERHPYEKVVSRAYWRAWKWQSSKASRRGNGKSMADWIEEMVENPDISDRRLYMDRNQLLVDRILPFESLWSSLAQLGQMWGCTLPDPIPRAKSRMRQDRRSAREILTSDQRRRIAERCSFEFELMGYER